MDPDLLNKLEAVMEQAAALNPDVSREIGQKSVNNMTPEEMIETLNVYIQKAKDDVSEARSKLNSKSQNNINISNN